MPAIDTIAHPDRYMSKRLHGQPGDPEPKFGLCLRRAAKTLKMRRSLGRIFSSIHHKASRPAE
jgi:hypothetical protein